MTERNKAGIIVCKPYGFYCRMIALCPNCKNERRMLVLDEPWHGLTHTCLNCGNKWQETFTYKVRPYKPEENPNWRNRRRKEARALWKKSPWYGGAEHKEWWRKESEAMRG